MFPAWSPSGAQIAYTSYMRNNPDLYVGPAGGRRPKQVAKYRGMNTGASWSPDGSKIALTLSKDGSPDIYVINANDGAVIRRLTNDKAIDTSPAWSPDGSQIAFVSDRNGGPQIFVVPAGGGAARQVSRARLIQHDADVVAAARQADPRVHHARWRTYDIVTLDLVSGQMTRITQNEGSNEEPSFSPNGRAIAVRARRPGRVHHERRRLRRRHEDLERIGDRRRLGPGAEGLAGQAEPGARAAHAAGPRPCSRYWSNCSKVTTPTRAPRSMTTATASGSASS